MPQNERAPQVRFKGFTDPWEQRKLGELYEKNDERNSCGFGAEKTFSIATMTLNDGGNGAAADSLPNYKVIRVGDVAFEGHANKEFAYGRFVVNDLIDGIMSPRFTCLRPRCGYPVFFWKHYIHNEQVMRDTLVKATKSGTMMNELVLDDLFEQPILVPTESEQELIGSLLTRLDTLITLHQRKCDKLSAFKKSMLEKMFPKPGCNVPEIRFAGFTDPWEQRKLGETCSIKTGFPFDSADFDDSGELLVITNGNIQNESSIVDSSLGNRITVDSTIREEYELNPGDILITMDGTVGRSAIVADEKMILAQRVGRLVPKFNGDFLYHWINTGAFSDCMSEFGHGGTIKHISLSEIAKYIGRYPTEVDEAEALGSFFSCFDSLITLHQRKLEMLKRLKKSCLQKMFV